MDDRFYFYDEHYHWTYKPDLIRVFCLSSSTVNYLDEKIAADYGATLLSDWLDGQNATGLRLLYEDVLGIGSVAEVSAILSRNLSLISLRASQCLQQVGIVPRGVCMTFALFAEIARRDKGTIRNAWFLIFSPDGVREIDFVMHINEIRKALNKPLLISLSFY